MLEVQGASQICEYMSLVSSRKFLSAIFSNTAFAIFLSSSFGNQIYVRFFSVHHNSCFLFYICHFLFISLCYIMDHFFCSVLQFIDSVFYSWTILLFIDFIKAFLTSASFVWLIFICVTCLPCFIVSYSMQINKEAFRRPSKVDNRTPRSQRAHGSTIASCALIGNN